MSCKNQHLSEQIKMVGTTKSRYPATPSAMITSNQKTDISPRGALLQREGETSRAATGTTGIELSKFLW